MTVKDFIQVSAVGNMTIQYKKTVNYFDIEHIASNDPFKKGCTCLDLFGDREIYIISALSADHVEIILKNEKN